MKLTLLDWSVIAAYFLFNLGIGIFYARRARGSTTDFFLSGRNVPWWLAGTSMVATTFAADTPLAVTGAKRSATLPEVGTMQDSGLTYELTGWYGILAPAGTPPAIVQKLRDEVVKAVAPPDIVKTLAAQGMEPRATQPADFAKYMASEFALYKQIVKDANIKPE